MYVLPADVRVIQSGLFALQNACDNDGEEHGDVENSVQASDDHESTVFAVRDIPIARQKFIHLFSMSQERTKRQS